MLILKKTLSLSCAIATLLLSAISSHAVYASQYVADLVPNSWEEVERRVDIREKMYSANLYGALANMQIMFGEDVSGSILPTSFDIEQIAVNGDDLSCRDPNGSDNLAALDPAYTKICSFTPRLVLSREESGVTVSDLAREYWMRVKFSNAANRVVKLRYQNPESPNCDMTNTVIQKSCYHVDGSGEHINFFSQEKVLSNNVIYKPSISAAGLQWAPLALKNHTYRVILKVSNGNVKVLNGLKMKISGSVSALPNDELLEGVEFSTACIFENEVTLTPDTYTCEFTAEEDGFIHIPFKRMGTGNRTVKTTIINLTP